MPEARGEFAQQGDGNVGIRTHHFRQGHAVDAQQARTRLGHGAHRVRLLVEQGRLAAAISGNIRLKGNVLALTTLDPVTALIIVDLQSGIVGSTFIHPIGNIVTRACSLIDAFRRRHLPIVLVNVDGVAPGRTERPRHAGQFPDGWTDLLPELGRQPGDIVVTKRTWGAFATTDLEDQLRARGVTQVVIAGVATGTGVESTARQAYEAGFNVTLALDAMTDPIFETPRYLLERRAATIDPSVCDWPPPPAASTSCVRAC